MSEGWSTKILPCFVLYVYMSFVIFEENPLLKMLKVQNLSLKMLKLYNSKRH